MTTPRSLYSRAGLWILTASLTLAVAGCGESLPSGEVVDPTAEQEQAQQNMLEFMKTQKGSKKASRG